MDNLMNSKVASACIPNDPGNKQVPDLQQFECLANLYKVLSSQSRLKILWALSEGEKYVFDLAEYVHMAMSAVSHQLIILKDANLVSFRRVGKKISYSLADDHVQTILINGLGHINECRWLWNDSQHDIHTQK